MSEETDDPEAVTDSIDLNTIREAIGERAAERSELAEWARDAGRRAGSLPD
ncbi:hypothetical protein [Halorubrum sp. Atlit-26R]|uniref:hypothetical protein n=1 Tax=Halorubrum sp. Atlit-26R TaxID=2282128 RepID=UPI001314C7FE|nr:hypothetical protein [Halorubrum sp. Atlit-26R]